MSKSARIRLGVGLGFGALVFLAIVLVATELANLSNPSSADHPPNTAISIEAIIYDGYDSSDGIHTVFFTQSSLVTAFTRDADSLMRFTGNACRGPSGVWGREVALTVTFEDGFHKFFVFQPWDSGLSLRTVGKQLCTDSVLYGTSSATSVRGQQLGQQFENDLNQMNIPIDLNQMI